MKTAKVLMIAALAVPAGAMAQSERTPVRIEPSVVYSPPAYSGAVRSCMDRQETLEDRKAYLDGEKRGLDREASAIARDGADLADELRRLPSNDPTAVASYNARSDQHNRRVADYNQRVAGMNAAASTLNGDNADLMAYCNFRYR